MSETKFGPKPPVVHVPTLPVSGDGGTRTSVSTIADSILNGRWGTDVFAYGAPSPEINPYEPFEPIQPTLPLWQPKLTGLEIPEPPPTRREFLLAIESLKAAFREMEEELRRWKEEKKSPGSKKEVIGYRVYSMYRGRGEIHSVRFFDVRVERNARASARRHAEYMMKIDLEVVIKLVRGRLQTPRAKP